MEAKNNVTRLEVFDFDGTLIDTPLPENGKPIWEKAYGKPWPHEGWWSRVESLDQDVFEMRALPQVQAAYKKAASRPDTRTIMLTGRRGDKPGKNKFAALMAAVKSILDNKGMTFDSYHYNYKGETSAYKVSELNKILAANPNIVDVTMYDDRHQSIFEEWGQSLLDSGRLKSFTFNHIG